MRYEMSREPTQEAYRELVATAERWGSLGLVVKRPEIELSPRGQRVLAQLTPFVTGVEESREWPGTTLYTQEEATVYFFQVVPESAELLRATATSLFQWCHPDLPEDLCFLGSDRSPWLISIAHERDAYLALSADESGGLHDVIRNTFIDRVGG